ncbi:MAG TPA: DUF1206 domain-containing protein [Gemmatimonadaceae bacterium]|nr:DUF1206 domain-containing protein [Gemmatimonadaceae bacterium]
MTSSVRPIRAQPDDHRNLRGASPALVMLGRAGYAAKGIVYVVIGALAAKAAIGSGGATTDSRGALGVIHDGPMGTIALVAIGIGLLGYMAWRLVAAVTDAEGKGDEPTKLVVRAAQAARGIVYGALGVQALRALGSDGGGGGSQGEQARHWTARLLDMPFGRALVVAVGLGVLGYAVYQVYRAFSDKAKKHLDLAEAGPTQAKWIVRFGRFGIAARAVVFAMIGVFLLRAGMQRDSGEAGGIAQSLQALGAADYGKLVLGAVAFGLIAYGIYQLATARYRHMRAVGV